MQDVIAVAASLATQLVQSGADAVVLAGSWVRGEASRESDVDLYALGEGPEYELLRRGGHLISLSYRTVEEVRASFVSPSDAGSVIPGWREALILADPTGVAGALQAEARRWTWSVIGDERCDTYVAGSITGYAEEVHKLVVALDRGNVLVAGVQRSLLATGLAMRLTVHFRLLYGSENIVWETVAERMGKEWSRAQQVALGGRGEPFAATCRAALELYALAMREVKHLLDEEQRSVVEHACRIAGFTV